MIGMLEEFQDVLSQYEWDVHCPEKVQTLTEEQLVALVSKFDGWIIGDDPATRDVFVAGMRGALKAAVKWGVGLDNVDLNAATELGLPVANTPGVFGADVADVAMSYVTALARDMFLVDRGVRAGDWPKPRGLSLRSKKLALVGYGHVGRNTARRALAADMEIIIYDPAYSPESIPDSLALARWPDRLNECDLIVFTCALTEENRHMLDREVLANAKDGVRIVNVARGALIETESLEAALEAGKVHSAALDVMEVEPLPLDSPLRRFERCIFGSHNGSNTSDAVRAASARAAQILVEFLGVAKR